MFRIIRVSSRQVCFEYRQLSRAKYYLENKRSTGLLRTFCPSVPPFKTVVLPNRLHCVIQSKHALRSLECQICWMENRKACLSVSKTKWLLSLYTFRQLLGNCVWLPQIFLIDYVLKRNSRELLRTITSVNKVIGLFSNTNCFHSR